MAINPDLVSIIPASEIPTGVPTTAGQFFFYEGNEMKKSPMSNIYDNVSSGLLPATTSTVPSATGFERYIVHEAGTYTNFKDTTNAAIVVTAADLAITNGIQANEVVIEVQDNVAVKRVYAKKGDKGDVADPAKLLLYSAIKSADITAGTQFIDDENGNIIYRVLPGVTLLTGELPKDYIDTKVNIVSVGTTSALLNVSKLFPPSSGFHTLQTAIIAIPLQLRSGGMTIRIEEALDTFKDYRLLLSSFNISQFNSVNNWTAVANSISDFGFGTSTSFSQSKATNELLAVNSRMGVVDGDYYYNIGYYMGLSGFVKQSGFKTTGFIKIAPTDVIRAFGTIPSNPSSPNVLFFDSNKAYISNLVFNSATNPFTLNSTNIPANAVYAVFNAVDTATTWIEINGKLDLSSRVLFLENNKNINDSVINNNLIGKQFSNAGYVNKSGVFVLHSLFACTDYIPLTQIDYLICWNSAKSGSLSNVTFFDSNKAFISTIDFMTTINPIELDSSNIPSNTAFCRINSETAKYAYYYINNVKDVKQISMNIVTHNHYGLKWTSLGDSITASGVWQKMVDRLLGTVSVVRGVGSSGLTGNFTGVAIQPDGTYIDRRSNYASDADFTTALSNAGYTNLVTSPDWHSYASNPSGYTLPAGSYFSINSQGSNQDRIDTIPVDSKIITVMFTTNDVNAILNNSMQIGTFDDLGTTTLLGNYRLMLSRIAIRAASAKIVLCIPPKMSSEISSGTRTATGSTFDQIRDAIRGLGATYGYHVVDFSKCINFNNLDKLADGIHPNTSGYRIIAEQLAMELAKISNKK